MHIAALKLTHFRNYAQLSLDCGPGINCLTGNNGEGKTNVLEAVHYLCMTRGWAAKTERYALQEGMPYFSVEGHVRGAEALEVQCNYMPPKGKRMLVDRRPLARMTDHIGRIPVVTVLPDDTELIHGTPGRRRRFMDALISQYAPRYLQALLAYEHVLAQRNALLALLHERGAWDAEQVGWWTAQLIPQGRIIQQQRAAFLAAFAPIFGRYFQQIVSDKETPCITLETQLTSDSEAEWETRMAEGLVRDRHAQRTGVGTHKDDLVFTIGGQAVKNYGSQGQQKTFVIALKLAEYELLEGRCQKAPILLLDDIFDKLDAHRLAAIARLLEHPIQGQVFISDTSLERIRGVFAQVQAREVRYYHVGAGQVLPVAHSTTPANNPA
jgi:DNA replication and repair protein RecF